MRKSESIWRSSRYLVDVKTGKRVDPNKIEPGSEIIQISHENYYKKDHFVPVKKGDYEKLNADNLPDNVEIEWLTPKQQRNRKSNNKIHTVIKNTCTEIDPENPPEGVEIEKIKSGAFNKRKAVEKNKNNKNSKRTKEDSQQLIISNLETGEILADLPEDSFQLSQPPGIGYEINRYQFFSLPVQESQMPSSASFISEIEIPEYTKEYSNICGKVLKAQGSGLYGLLTETFKARMKYRSISFRKLLNLLRKKSNLEHVELYNAVKTACNAEIDEKIYKDTATPPHAMGKVISHLHSYIEKACNTEIYLKDPEFIELLNVLIECKNEPHALCMCYHPRNRKEKDIYIYFRAMQAITFKNMDDLLDAIGTTKNILNKWITNQTFDKKNFTDKIKVYAENILNSQATPFSDKNYAIILRLVICEFLKLIGCDYEDKNGIYQQAQELANLSPIDSLADDKISCEEGNDDGENDSSFGYSSS